MKNLGTVRHFIMCWSTITQSIGQMCDSIKYLSLDDFWKRWQDGAPWYVFFCTRMCSPQTCRRSPGADGILQIHCLQHGAIVPSLILENERQLTMEYCERWFSQPACVCVLHFLFENPLTFLYSVVMMDHPVLNSTRVVSCAVHSLSGLHIQIVKH